MGIGIILNSPYGNYSLWLEFQGTNNVHEYEAFLLGLNLYKYFGVKVLYIIGDFDLIIMKDKSQFACKNERLKRYRNAAWDSMESFDSFSLEEKTRDFNKKIWCNSHFFLNTPTLWRFDGRNKIGNYIHTFDFG